MNTIRINRQGGLGDVVMALCAAHAIHFSGHEIILATDPKYHELAHACPSVREVVIGGGIDLNPAKYGLSVLHQVDAYLADLGFIEPDSANKFLQLDRNISSQVPNKIALHPGIGDVNRTWPTENWLELANRLKANGNHVVIIGSKVGSDGRGAINLLGFDSAWGVSHLELVELLDTCKVLVSTDSGPIQLAGATDCSVVGIYSVVKGRNRLPYRSTSNKGKNLEVPCKCPHHPCYQKIQYGASWAAYGEPLLAIGMPLGEVFGRWCVNCEQPYRCMEDLTVEEVHAKINEALAESA
jgi:ADP-heptose:LPS heptosyltransferase